MTSENQPLTGGTENLRGFVGRRNLKYSLTFKKERPKLTFDLCILKEDVSRNIAPIWRHCVCYDGIAESLKDIRPGALLKVSGWLTASYMLNNEHKRVMFNDAPVTIETLIVTYSEIERVSEDRQMAFRPVPLEPQYA